MTTPRIGAPELATSQANKEETVNEIVRYLEAGGGSFFNIFNKGTTAPPGSPTDGMVQIVGNSATGAWSGFTAGNFALYIENSWVEIAAQEGSFAYDQSTDRLLKNNGGGGLTAWVVFGTTLNPVLTDANDYTLLAIDVGKYIRLTGAGTKDIIIQDDATEPLPANGEWHIRNVGAGDATIDDTDVTVNVPAGGTLVIPQGGTVTLKRVATDEFDLFGQVTAA